MDLDEARRLYSLSGRAVVAAPTHTLEDPDGSLPGVVLEDGPPALFVFPVSLLGYPIEHLDDEERDDYLDSVVHAAGLR